MEDSKNPVAKQEDVSQKLSNTVAKKIEFYDGSAWVDISAGDVSGKEREITVSPKQNAHGKVVSIATNPIIPGDMIVNSTGFLKIPVGTSLQRPVAPQVGMMRFCIEAYTNVSAVPAFSPALSPIGTGISDTIIDYNKFNNDDWILEIQPGFNNYVFVLYPSGTMILDMIPLASLTVSELNFIGYGLLLRWSAPITFSVLDSFQLTFS